NPAEETIRTNMIKNGVVECVAALPARMFRETSAPVTLWVLRKPSRDSRRDVLFIDATSAGTVIDRTYRVLTDEDISRITGAYRDWRGSRPGEYRGVPDFAAAVTSERILGRSSRLAPAPYVATGPAGIDVDATMASLRSLRKELDQHEYQAACADAAVAEHLRRIDL
ncbi:N-6 DNA methylase, partial [Parafrankia soli]|uniref:N-6 DNA methylase n=1 Tax=Parafrankia soli TaxID=2599596 RepID=UPI001041D3B6